MQKIGLLCGLSWLSTKIYYENINRIISHKLGGLHSAKLIMNNVNNNEFVYLVENKKYDLVKTRLKQEVQILEQAGCHYFGLTCNTLHYFLNQINDNKSIINVNILESIVNYIKKYNKDSNHNKITTIGVLATKYSVELELHKKYLNTINVKTIYPNTIEAEYINQAIFNVCSGKSNNDVKKNISTIVNSLLDKQCDAILLGCTELGLLVNTKHYPVPIIDSALIHARDLASYAFLDSPLYINAAKVPVNL